MAQIFLFKIIYKIPHIKFKFLQFFLLAEKLIEQLIIERKNNLKQSVKSE
jgi:hypothetical protein